MHLWPNAYRNGQTAMAKQHFRDGDMLMFYALSRELGGIDSLAFTSNGRALEWSYHPEHIDIARVELATTAWPQGIPWSCALLFASTSPAAAFRGWAMLGNLTKSPNGSPSLRSTMPRAGTPCPTSARGSFIPNMAAMMFRLTLPANYTVGATGDLVPGSEDNEAEKGSFGQLGDGLCQVGGLRRLARGQQRLP
jgi:hypothetical protein